MRLGKIGRPSRRGNFDGERKPRFHKMNSKGKKSFVRAMIANNDLDEFNEVLTAMKREAED